MAAALRCLYAPYGRAMKTATDRAVETIEAAEIMFAEEMGATLDLSPAAKMALIVKIAAAIEAAVTEEKQKLT
jgi:rhamnose utilization protein RhaD (predicted bifunctional aldolase and dehydrogenase)